MASLNQPPQGRPPRVVSFSQSTVTPQTTAPRRLTHPSSATTPPAASSAPEQNGLQHFSYGCPGLSGPDCRMDVQSVPLHDLILAHPGRKFVIPLFQRKYCWGEKQGVQWFTDVSTKGKPMSHHVGKIVMKLHEGHDVVVDGQQRLTTTSLLLTAVRDAALALGVQRELPSDVAGGIDALVDTIEGFLFTDVAGAREATARLAATVSGAAHSVPADMLYAELQPHLKLVPSYADRAPFMECLALGALRHRNERGSLCMSPLAAASPMGVMKLDIFDHRVAEVMASLKDAPATTRVAALSALATNAVRTMYGNAMYILTPINFAQVFLWLQEKSLFGMGAILWNPAPGVDFQASDLVRNFLFAPFMHLSSEDQEALHRQYWLLPLELPLGSPEALDARLNAFLHANADRSYTSEFEDTVGHVASLLNKADVKKDGRGMALYSSFYSYYESLDARHEEIAAAVSGATGADRSRDAAKAIYVLTAIAAHTSS